MEQTDFDLALDFDVDALFPFLSNTDTWFFNFDSFVDDVFSIPNSASQSETTIPRFTEMNDDEQVEMINTDDNETIAGPAPAIVSQVESGKKTRTRRKTTAIVKGCNMYGRAGKKRCIQCRKWRQKCVYETLDDPCKLCRERGFPCGREEKVLGPKAHLKLSDEDLDVSSRQLVFAVPRHSPSILPDELTPAEIHCFSTLIRWPHRNGSVGGILFQSCAPFARHYPPMATLILWPDFPLSSKVFRYATLTLCSSIKPSLTDNPNGDAPAYRTKFYRYMREAIDASSILEVFVASYAMVTESWYVGKHLQTLITHYKGMSAAYSLLSGGSSTAATSYSASYGNRLMQSSTRMVFEAYFLRPPFESTQFEQCRELDECVRALIDSPAIGRTSIDRLWNLDLYLRFYMDYYLLLKRKEVSSTETSDVRSRILAILSDIFRLVPFVPKVTEVINAALDPTSPWPWHGNSLIMENVLGKFLTKDESDVPTAAMIYGLAILMAETFGGSISPLQSLPEFNISPGLFLCRLCALVSSFDTQRLTVVPRFHFLPRLFWAGVGLTDGVDYAASAWVCDMLNNHAFWTDNKWLYSQDQWCLSSLRQSLSYGNTEGRQPGVPLLECKGINVLECNRIAERAACHRQLGR